MRRIKIKTILIASFISGLFLVPSFLCAFAQEEGTLSNNIITLFFAKLFYILRFPTHTLFFSIFSKGTILFFGGLVMNCLFYGFITERIIYVYKRIKN